MSVEFLFDFGSPNAYLAHRAIPQIEKRTGVRFTYVPVLLGGIFKLTNNKSPAETLAGVRNKPAVMKLETQRFLRRYGLKPYVWNPNFPVMTLNLMRCAVAAEMEGALMPFVEAAFHHTWEAPKKMDDPDIARAALKESGIDADHLFARAQEPEVKARLVAATDTAVARGAFGAPTFFVGTDMFFGKEQLRDVEELLTVSEPMSA
jgi:2-hydroxychromene-2-carboxylate isomerase